MLPTRGRHDKHGDSAGWFWAEPKAGSRLLAELLRHSAWRSFIDQTQRDAVHRVVFFDRACAHYLLLIASRHGDVGDLPAQGPFHIHAMTVDRHNSIRVVSVQRRNDAGSNVSVRSSAENADHDAQQHEISGAGEPIVGTSEGIAVERPLEIRINGQSFSVTMCTPGADAQLAHGLLYAEGVISAAAWYRSEHGQRDCALASAIIDLEIPESEVVWPQTERRLQATSSCGLCGVASLDGLTMGHQQMKPAPTIRPTQMVSWMSTMQAHQAAFAQAGGTHAAAAFDVHDQCLACAEDIGRHNAVDKVVGAMLQRDCVDEAVAMVVSGRVSFEIMTKCLRARIPILAAVSAPSTLAVDLARENGVTLLGFCRDRRCTVYSGADRVESEEGIDVRIVTEPQR